MRRAVAVFAAPWHRGARGETANLRPIKASPGATKSDFQLSGATKSVRVATRAD
jgi:hypothetical protein